MKRKSVPFYPILLTLALGSLWSVSAVAEPLDERRLEALRATDADFRLDGQDPALPTPNLRLKYGFHDFFYLEKALAIFERVVLGDAPPERKSEANQLLRYHLHKPDWSMPEAGSIVGQYPSAWNHRTRSLAVRIYARHRQALAPDIRGEFERRLETAVTGPFMRKSENIKYTNNSAIFLAHELLDRTNRDSFDEVRSWLSNNLKETCANGPHEWGSLYNDWTLGSILNLADLAEDAEISQLATMCLDYLLAVQAGFSNSGKFASPAVRQYFFWSTGGPRPQGVINRILFTGDFAKSWENMTEWAASDYRPLQIVAEKFTSNEPGTFRWTTSRHGWRYQAYRGASYVAASAMHPEPDDYALSSGGTHDIVGAAITSTTSASAYAFALGYRPERPPAKRRNLRERYFSHDSVLFVHHGGTVQAVWAGGRFENVRIRFFHSRDFTREIDSGWAFMSDGETFIVWAPTIGAPQLDPESSDFSDPAKTGWWLRSTHAPDANGEIAVIEVGSRTEHGSFAAFKNAVKTRNARPRLQNGRVTYQTPRGDEVVFGAGAASVNGIPFDGSGFPGALGHGLDGLRLESGPRAVTFDFENVEIRGNTERIGDEVVRPPEAEPDALVIESTGWIDAASYSAPYEFALQARGGDGDLAWELADGSLPPGLELSPSGRIEGVPEAAGHWRFSLSVVDQTGSTAEAELSLEVRPRAEIRVARASLDERRPQTDETESNDQKIFLAGHISCSSTGSPGAPLSLLLVVFMLAFIPTRPEDLLKSSMVALTLLFALLAGCGVPEGSLNGEAAEETQQSETPRTDVCSENDCAASSCDVEGCAPEICNNGLDDDGDGLPDCHDADCLSMDICAGVTDCNYEHVTAAGGVGGIEVVDSNEAVACLRVEFELEVDLDQLSCESPTQIFTALGKGGDGRSLADLTLRCDGLWRLSTWADEGSTRQLAKKRLRVVVDSEPFRSQVRIYEDGVFGFEPIDASLEGTSLIDSTHTVARLAEGIPGVELSGLQIWADRVPTPKE